MTANLASGPLNLVNELVFVRLYMKSDNAITLKYARGTMNGETYRPSDDLESLMYEYRIWLYDNNPRELVLKEIPGLYPIPSLTAKLAEFLGIVYRYTRFGEVDRESWMKLMAKCAGGLSLVDSDLALTVEEARMVSKYDVWSGSIEAVECSWDEGLVLSAWPEVQHDKVREIKRTVNKPLEIEEIPEWGDKTIVDTPLGPQSVSKSAMCIALQTITHKDGITCRHTLEECGWDLTLAISMVKR